MEADKLTDSGLGPPPGSDGQTDTGLTDIETLKEKFEQQKATKIKAEQIVSTLSRIKAREKASRRSLRNSTEKKNEDTLNIAPPLSTKKSTAQTNAQKEKSNLLKRKLEEERAKFQSQRGHEELGRVSEIVEHLRVQLEDRDKTIQQIHTNLVSTPKHAPLQHVDSQSNEPKIPDDVKQRISDLEAKVLDLQENLKEKDSVISARTQAITLLSEDMARKGKHTLDTLEETRCQMKEMQSNFSTLEERMNQERTRLKEELEDRKVKHQQAEKNFRAAEAARFTLSTRVAELQEKVVALQTKNISLEEELTESNNKAKEMKDALDAANKQSITMKAQFKAKLKAFEKEKDALKKEEDGNTEMNLLKERIADLEDEKETAKLLKERIGEMEEKLVRQENDLDNHVKAMAMLEAEKFDLVQNEKERSILAKQQEDLIENLKNKISELEETKVTAELKCVELEEKLDTFIKEKNETICLQSELQSAQSLLLDQQSSIADLTQKLELKQEQLAEFAGVHSTSFNKDIQDLESDLREWKLKYEDIELKLNSALSKCAEWESKVNGLQNENHYLLQQCDELKIVIQKFENSVTVPSQIDERVVASLQEELEKKEFEINRIMEENKIKDSELVSLKKTLESTGTELQRLTLNMENINETNRKLEELNTVVDAKDKQLDETTDKLKKVTKKLSEYKKFHKLKCEDVLKISQELETVSASSQERILGLETQLSNALEIEQSLRKELEQLSSSGVEKKPDEVTQKMKKLAASVKLKTKAIKDFEEKLSKMEKLLEEKENFITELENNKAEWLRPMKSSDQERVMGETKSTDELNEALLKSDSDTPANVHDIGSTLMNQIKQLESDNAQLQEALNGNYILIEQLNEDLSETRSMNNTLITQFDNMQKSYSDEEVKTKSILDQFDTEMFGNKKEIENLVDQLSESTRKYEQAWAKLQEKDAYIENIEQEFEKVKSKMLQIQTKLDERQETFEIKTEELGCRLQEAEIAKETSQQYEDELEHKIANLVSTEMNLKSNLEKIKLENDELLKSSIEVRESNQNLLQELSEEKNKVKDLRNNLEELNERISKVNYTDEQVDSLTSELKMLRTNYENQIRQLEEKDKINAYNFETEMNRLTEHIKIIESERNELAENYENLTTEKYNLNEEIQNLTEIINNAHKLHVEQLDQVKVDFEKAQNIEKEQSLKEINRILEEHSIHVGNLKTSFMTNEQNYCLNIQNLDSLNKELESELNLLRQQYSQIRLSFDSCQQEVLHLQDLLFKERNENDSLKIALVKEKAQIQIQDVVTTAEDQVNSMLNRDGVGGMNFFKWNDEKVVMGGNSLLNIAQSTAKDNLQTTDSNSERITDLENRLHSLTCERDRLELKVKELESRINAVGEAKVASDPEDWPINKDEEDGWGFTDAMLEAEHIQKQKANSDMVESRITDLQNKLKESETDRSRLSEELKASQIKCGKLMKKAKEFKTKIDEMGKTKSVGFDDLDFAMQQELRSQIDNLEKTLKETKTDINTMKIEKEGFLKRIDTLTSGNERLVDMKERQDIEVEMWKKRSNDLAHQMQALEWRIQELMAEQNEPQTGEVMDEERQRFIQNAMELEEKLNSVATENEYLLRVLGEARDQQKKLESSVNLNERIDELLNENEKLNDELEMLKKESSNINQVNIETEKLRNENVRLHLILDNLNTKLSTEYKQHFDDSVELSKRIDFIMEENKWLSSTVNNLNTEIHELKNILEDLKMKENETNELKKEKELLNEIVRDLNDQLSEEKIKHGQIFQDIPVGNQSEIDRLSAENVKLVDELDKQSSEIVSLQNNLSAAVSELESIKSKTMHQHQLAVENEPILFRGFTDTSSVDLIDSTDNDREVEALQEQISALNRLLQDKENELESMKQYVECSNMGKENLQDEFDDKIQQMHDDKVQHMHDDKVQQLHDDKLQQKHDDKVKQKHDEKVQQMHDEKVQQIHDDKVQQMHDENEPVLFRGFTDTSSVDLIDSTDNEREVEALQEQISTLNRLLEDKESELESMKQYVECSNMGKESLQDEFDDKVQQMHDENEATHSIDTHEVNSLNADIVALKLLVQCKDKELNQLKTVLEQMKTDKEKDHDEVSKDNINVLKENLIALNLLLQSKDSELFDLKVSLEQMKIDNERIQKELVGTQEKIQIQPSIVLEKTSFPGLSGVAESLDMIHHREKEQLTEQVALLSRLLEDKDKEIEALKYQITSNHSNSQSAVMDIDQSCKVNFEDPPAFRGFAATSSVDDIFPIQKQTSDIQSLELASEAQHVFVQPQGTLEQLQNEIKCMKQGEQKKIEKYRKEIKVVKDENSLLNKLLQEKETELELLKQEIECARVEKENLQDEFALRIQELETHKLTEHTEIQGSQEDQQLSSEVFAKLNNDILELKDLLQFRESHIEMITQQNQQIVFEKDGMLQTLKEELEAYKLKSNAAANEIEKMKVEIEALNISIANDLNSKYQIEIATLQNELSTREQKLMNSVNDLHNVKKDYEMKLLEVESKCEIYASENESLKEELNLVNQQHATVQGLLQDNANRIETEMMVNMRDLEEKLQKAESDYHQALTELSEKQRIISEIEGKLEEYSSLQNEISVSKQRVHELEEELCKIQNTKDESINDLTLQLKTKEAEVENYKHERSEEKVTRSDLELPVASTLSNEVLHYQEEIRLRDEEIAKLTKTLGEMQERLFKKEEGRLHSIGEDILTARLDEALYTLHLRDVRCDELTLELMQLLEERDTLQLRLSTAIRMNEGLKGKHKPSNEASPVPISDTSSVSDIPVESDNMNQDESVSQLNEKLGQLHNVGYRRDPGVQTDREKRYSEQMHLYSQHSTREEEPSSGFFSWIFGASSSSSSQDV